MAKYSVVDVETTGLGGQDRVIEISVVTLDSDSYEIIDEYDTLINPLRDVGPTHIHGITASHVAAAPTFAEIAGTLANVLDGSILVAHNISFDRRMLKQEFERIGFAVDFGSGFCTLKATGMKLSIASETFGIELVNAHRALADARATAELLKVVKPNAKVLTPITFASKPVEEFPRTLRRDAVGGGALPRKTSPFRFRFPSVDESALSYLHMLNNFLDDGKLDSEELRELAELAKILGISDMRDSLHQAFFDSVFTAAMRDDLIDTTEAKILNEISRAFNIVPQALPEPKSTHAIELNPEIRVCFTGAVVLSGSHFERNELHLIATSLGLFPVMSVTKKGCDLLVAADVSTQSGKAAQARKFGIPIMPADEFLEVANRRLEIN